MSSFSENELTTAKFICEQIIQSQVDCLPKMNAMGAVAWEQQEEDQREREEDTVHVMEAEEVLEARAMRKAAKKAKQKAWELESEADSSPRKKKARAGSSTHHR